MKQHTYTHTVVHIHFYCCCKSLKKLLLESSLRFLFTPAVDKVFSSTFSVLFVLNIASLGLLALALGLSSFSLSVLRSTRMDLTVSRLVSLAVVFVVLLIEFSCLQKVMFIRELCPTSNVVFRLVWELTCK